MGWRFKKQRLLGGQPPSLLTRLEVAVGAVWLKVPMPQLDHDVQDVPVNESDDWYVLACSATGEGSGEQE